MMSNCEVVLSHRYPDLCTLSYPLSKSYFDHTMCMRTENALASKLYRWTDPAEHSFAISSKLSGTASFVDVAAHFQNNQRNYICHNSNE